MTEEELRRMLLSAKNLKIDKIRKETDIRGILQSARNTRGLPRLSYWERVCAMAGYLSLWVWGMQAAIILACGYLVCISDWRGSQMLFTMAAPLIGCIGCIEIQRGYSCGMWEMEKACRYDLRQVVLLKMQIMGGIDLAIVLCMVGYSKGLGTTLSGAVLTILVPYLLSSFVYFMLLCRMDRRISNYLLVGTGLIMSFGSGMFVNCIDAVSWERINAHGEWTAVLTLAALDLMVIAMKRFLKSCDREENGRWSFD